MPQFGSRRLWIIFAQFGMAISIGTLLLIPDLKNELGLVIKLLFIHNIYASLRDVSTDALDVDVRLEDEVFKANSAILNSMLTLLNERVYIQGATRTDVPLLCLFGASNEVPEDEDLAALFDRFLRQPGVEPAQEPQRRPLGAGGRRAPRSQGAAGSRRCRAASPGGAPSPSRSGNRRR